MCVANNASVDINLNTTLYGRREHTATNLSFFLFLNSEVVPTNQYPGKYPHI